MNLTYEEQLCVDVCLLLDDEKPFEAVDKLRAYIEAPKAENAKLREELRLATIGRCRCSDCGKEVNNAWRDSDGHHCLTCLAKQRDEAREAIAASAPVIDVGF